MRLTILMKAELDIIRAKTRNIIKKMDPHKENISSETKELFDASIREVTTYMVRLENLLCETDKKGHAHL